MKGLALTARTLTILINVVSALSVKTLPILTNKVSLTSIYNSFKLL